MVGRCRIDHRFVWLSDFLGSDLDLSGEAAVSSHAAIHGRIKEST